MKLSRIIGLCAVTILSVGTFACNDVSAENATQISNGIVRLRGGPESENVAICILSNGNLQLTYSDLTNSQTRVYEYSDVTGLIIEMKGGENSVEFHGDVTIDGNLTITSDGDCTFRSQINGADSLVVAGNFNFWTQNGDDTFLVSYEEDSIDVGGDMNVLTGDFGIETIRIGNCVVAGECEIRTGAGFDSVAVGVNQINGLIPIDGITTGGDLTIHTGIVGHTDFVIFKDCIVGGDLLIVTGVGDDQISVQRVEIFGDATIKAGRDSDMVYFSTTVIHGSLLLNSGAGHDIVDILSSDFLRRTSVYLMNGDDDLTIANSSFQPSTFIHGGNGFDSASQTGSSFAKGPLVLYVEDQDF